MNTKNRAVILAVTVLMVMSGMTMIAFASESNSSLSMGSWQVDPNAVNNWHVNAADVNKWFSASWGTNVAETAGAVDYPYQFLYGNFFMNGVLSAQSITVNIAINWAVVEKNPAYALSSPVPGYGATTLGAPGSGSPGWEEVISTGIGSGAVSYFSGYPFHIYVVSASGTTLASTNLYTSTSTSDYSVTLQPNQGYNGTIYIEIYSMMYTEWDAQPIKYFPLYIGVGEFTQLTANVQGSTSLVKGSGPAYLNFTFNAGNWSINFDRVTNGNPQNLSATNLQVLKTYHFTYAGTGGVKNLVYNFTSDNPPGIYVWMFNESVTKYGSTFVVHDLKTSFPPRILTWMSPGKLDSLETVSVMVVSNVSQMNITIYLSVWYGNDEYLLPPPGTSNVLYDNSPYHVISGQNFTLSFKNSMDGQLNMQVIANASGSLNLSRDFTTIATNTTSPPTGNVTDWFVWPPWGPGSNALNIIFLISGIGVLLYAIGTSLSDVEIEDEAKRAMKMRERASMLGEQIQSGASQFSGNLVMGSPHFGVAIALLIMSILNWGAILHALDVGLIIAPIGMVMAGAPSLGKYRRFFRGKLVSKPSPEEVAYEMIMQDVKKTLEEEQKIEKEMRAWELAELERHYPGTHIASQFKKLIQKKEEGGAILDAVVALIILLIFIMLVVHF